MITVLITYMTNINKNDIDSAIHSTVEDEA